MQKFRFCIPLLFNHMFKQSHMGEHQWLGLRGGWGTGVGHMSLCGSRQLVTDSLSPGNSVNRAVMFRSTHLLCKG